MSRTIEIASNKAASSWTDISAIIPWLDTKWGGEAHDLEVGTGSGFDLDDDAGTRSLPAKRVVRVIETATTPDTVIFKGRVSDKTLARGQMPQGDAKAFDVGLDDNNSQAYGIPVDGWIRPAETGRARAMAAIAAYGNGSPRASTVIATTYAPNSNTVSMPKKTYNETDLAGVLRDCAEAEGKQVFITVDDELFYDRDTSTAYAAGLAITDNNPNLTTQFPPDDAASGEEQGNEFFTGATIKYGTGGGASVSEVRAAAETAHDYWRTVITDSDATAATATQRLATMLDNQSVEEKTYRCTLTLTAAQIDLIKYGHTVSFRSAAAGVLTPVTLRVASCYKEPVGVDIYQVHLELGTPEKFARRVNTDGPLPPGPFVPVMETEPAFMILYQPAGVGLTEVQWGSTGDAPGGGCATLPTTGDLAAGGPGPFTGISVLAPGRLTCTFRTSASRVCGGETMTTTFLIRRSGVTVATVVTTPQVFTFPGSYTVDETVTIADVLVSLGDLIDARVVMEGSSSGVVAPDALPTGVGGCGNKLEVSGELETGVILNAPTAGQEVHDPAFIGDGSTTSYAALFPYAAGSLRVEVTGLDWTAQVTETDPTTGDFDLAYAPPVGATVKVYYVGA